MKKECLRFSDQVQRGDESQHLGLESRQCDLAIRQHPWRRYERAVALLSGVIGSRYRYCTNKAKGGKEGSLSREEVGRFVKY